MTVPYFAYGSNMGQSALRERCPSARQLGIARVEGFRLGFTRRSEKRGGGVADLVPAPGSVVWGVLFDVGDELELLDGYEGVPTAYRRELWKVTTPEGAVVEAWVYVVVQKAAEMLPSREYWELLVEGAREAALPGEYVAEIERIAHLPRATLALVSALAERRARVNRLLTEAASHKLQRAGSSHALQRAREAHELASASPKLQPWAALAAYRLAHLVLREPRTRETLEEADALFAEAGREPLLGPYPRIYRLALLERLGASRAVVERTFAEAVGAHDAWVRGRDGSAPSVTIQTDLFAMLELAGYFLDLDRAPLEGRGARPDEPYLREAHWRLVGPDPGLADVSLSEATALAELDALAPTLAPAFVFRLPPDRAGAVLRVGEGPWSPLPHRAARLLACLLRQHAADGRELVLRVMGSDGRAQQTALRQVRHRLADQLRARGLAPPEDLVVTAPGERPRLAAGLVVLGAVSDAGYADTDPE